MYFRLYNKAAGRIISSNTQIVTNTPTIQQLPTQNITRNTTQPPINSSYNFIVRKDSHLMNRQMYDAYMFGVSQLNNAILYKSRDYINTLLTEDINIDNRIKEKVNSYDLTQNVTQIVENYNVENGISNASSINQAIQNAIAELNLEKHYFAHYSCDPKFSKGTFPNHNIGEFPHNNVFYDTIREWYYR
jgi:hypothetical protein